MCRDGVISPPPPTPLLSPLSFFFLSQQPFPHAGSETAGSSSGPAQTLPVAKDIMVHMGRVRLRRAMT
jgi:hypothetical protein